uniref:Lipocalin n=1 Tax=Rhipicephalus zambeziensis TaxID=60191 RepID=A0A224YLD0_9ACAR
MVLKQAYEVYDNLSGTHTLKENTKWRVEQTQTDSNEFWFTRLRDRVTSFYNLTYWNNTEKCFIFTFNMTDTQQCELDVWGALPDNDTAVSSCEAVFNKTCQPHHVYYPGNCDQPSTKRSASAQMDSSDLQPAERDTVL